MKFSHLLFAASLFTFGTAAAQTTTTPGTPGAPSTTTASPSTVPSGISPEQANPKGNVSPSEVFTKGSPTNTNANDRRMKRQQNKAMKADGKNKMKTTM